MLSRYTRGAVERSRYALGTVLVRSRYARGAVEQSRYALGTVLVRSRYAQGVVEVRSWHGPSTVEVRSWCASGSLRFVNFSTGDTVHLREGTRINTAARTVKMPCALTHLC